MRARESLKVRARESLKRETERESQERVSRESDAVAHTYTDRQSNRPSSARQSGLSFSSLELSNARSNSLARSPWTWCSTFGLCLFSLVLFHLFTLGRGGRGVVVVVVVVTHSLIHSLTHSLTRRTELLTAVEKTNKQAKTTTTTTTTNIYLQAQSSFVVQQPPKRAQFFVLRLFDILPTVVGAKAHRERQETQEHQEKAAHRHLRRSPWTPLAQQ